MMFKLIIRIFEKVESTFCRKAHSLPTCTQTSEQQAHTTLLLQGRVQHGDKNKTRTTRPGTGSHLGYSLNQWGWEGTTLGWRRAFYSRGEPSSGAECVSSPCSPSSRFPFSNGCAAASLSTAAVDLSGFSGDACGVLKSGPHPMTSVPSMTWSSPIAGTGVPLLVHSCILWSRACLRLSWATASLLTAAAALASAWAARICCSARWVCSLRILACSSKS